jgi:oligopeptide transport system substrate-binding protein
MAIDKRAVARTAGPGKSPLASVIPPMPGYNAPASLPVRIGGIDVDVLSFDPEAARALMANAGYGSELVIPYLFPAMSEFALIAEVLQQQWRDNLGIQVRLMRQETRAWIQTVLNVSYTGIAAWGDVAGLEDPSWFLDIFKSPAASGSGWSDPRFLELLTVAESATDPQIRVDKLAQCERALLRAMPCVPLYSEAWTYLCKPYVKGFAGSPFHGRIFNNVRIDTNWGLA